jgi:hypothetical protein
MTFQDLENRYAELEQQYRGGALTSDQFNAHLATMMTKDEQGRWWTKRRGDGAWRVYDGTSWVAANPFAATAAPAQPMLALAGAPGAMSAQPVAQPMSPPVAQPVDQPAEQPKAGMGAKAFLYYALSIIPIFGLVLWLSFRKSEEPAKRAIAPILGIIAICSFVIGIVLNAM